MQDGTITGQGEDKRALPNTKLVATPAVGLPDATLAPLAPEAAQAATEALQAQVAALQAELDRRKMAADALAGKPSYRCDVCGEVKPLTNEYWPRNRARKSGFGTRCHVCNRVAVRSWADSNRPKVNRQQQKRYWSKRKAGFHRVTTMIAGKEVTSWKPVVQEEVAA